MDLNEAFVAYKNKIGERLTRKLISALEEEKITQEELSTISSYILDNIDKANNNSDLLDFLEHISQKWPIFADNVIIEKADIAESNKEQKVDQVENLIQNNKLDEALKVASAANDQGGGN